MGVVSGWTSKGDECGGVGGRVHDAFESTPYTKRFVVALVLEFSTLSSKPTGH